MAKHIARNLAIENEGAEISWLDQHSNFDRMRTLFEDETELLMADQCRLTA